MVDGYFNKPLKYMLVCTIILIYITIYCYYNDCNELINK